MRTFVGLLAAVALAAHLTALPPTLEDLDSVNFALGVRNFDVAQHQPHPPGYPVYIALAKLATAALTRAGVAAPDVRGLAVWSAIGLGLLPVLVFAFFRRVQGGGDFAAASAALLTVVCPLVWFNASRPLSDVSGLAAAWAALAALMAGSALGSGERREPPSLMLIGLGAFVAGLSIGFRSQMAVLTLPLLLWVFVAVGRARLVVLAASAAGVLLWAVPLILLSGGPRRYLDALGGQAGEDFAGVVMLWSHPTPRVAAFAILDTFVRPWDSPMLAGVMLVLGTAGAASLVRWAPRALAILAVTFGPYAVFHLLFQEPLTMRYALPLVPLMAFLSAVSFASVDRRAAWTIAAGLCLACLTRAIPATAAFAATPSPTFAVLSEMRMLEERGAQPLVGMHRRIFTESRRARIYAGNPPGTLLPTPRDYEWLELTRAWREGYGGETWFLADPRRTDLALIDRAHARTREYRWPFKASIYAGGVRPDEIDWHVLTDPGWFLEHGWALTPETAGIANREGWGPHRRPSVGWLRRHTGDSLMMIGGRHLGGDEPANVIVEVDDRPLTTMTVRPGFFLDFVPVPGAALAGPGTFARLTVRAVAASGGASPPVAIEQFNWQSPDRVQFGFDEGWFEPEYNPTTAQSWRWMSERAVIRVHHAGRDVVVRVSGESPLHYFDAEPTITIAAGDRVLGELSPSSDFTHEVVIPADALTAAGGRVVLRSNRTFSAGEAEGTADPRRLALRVYSVRVEPR